MKRPRREKEEGQGEKETEKKTSFSSFDMKKKKKNHTFLKHESPLLDQQTKQKYLHQVIYWSKCVCAHVEREEACVCVI